MIKQRRLSRIFVPIFAAAVGTLFLLGVLSGLALASPGDLFVTPGGSGDCSQPTPCDLHAALALAGDGDTVYVAQGTYTGTGEAVISVTNSITLYGGWDGTMTEPPVRDPKINPTTLDGEGLRQVVYITGTITPTLEGLRLTGGSSSGRGGGVIIYGAHPVISACRIWNNTGKDGGGVFLAGSANAVLVNNEIYGNTADQYGGGVAFDTSPNITLTGNTFYSNTAHEDGGAISLWSGDNANVSDNDVYSNTSDRDGGGIYIREGSTVLANNVISRNIASAGGGGMYIENANITLVDNRVSANTSTSGGGGLCFTDASTVTLTGNYVYSNTSTSAGGGIYLNTTPTATLTGNHIYDNAASDAGGIYLYDADGSTLTGNRIYDNRVTSYKHGGGVYLSDSDGVTLADNWVYSNTARYGGGGLYISSVTATLTGNQIVSNTTINDDGGGVYAAYSGLTLTHNIVRYNTTLGNGGGLAFWDSEAVLDGNQVVGNVAGSEAGIGFDRSTATLVNNVVADNVKMGFPCASGIGIKDSVITLMHNTIARNHGFVPGSGIYVMEPDLHGSVVTLVNNIIVSHTVGITVAAGNTATLDVTLWGGGAWANETTWGGAGDISSNVGIWSEPRFIDPDAGDYHVSFWSAAVDQGVDAGVMTDMDGDRRPIGAQPDIGADEAWCRVLLPLVLRNRGVTR